MSLLDISHLGELNMGFNRFFVVFVKQTLANFDFCPRTFFHYFQVQWLEEETNYKSSLNIVYIEASRRMMWRREEYTVKKGSDFPVPSQGCHLPNSPWTGSITLIPARESLVSDI